MGTPIDILAVAAGSVACSLLIAIAFGRSSARADDNTERLRARHLRESSRTITTVRLRRARSASASAVSYAGVAGLAAAHETISREPSITLPSSRTRVGTMRLPVSRSTS